MFHSSSSSQPAEVFRKDLISAMKLPDSHQLQPEEYWVIQDQWKQEWEKGVQVPVDDTAINEPQFFEVLMQDTGTFELPEDFIKCYSGSEEQMKQAEERQRQIEATCQYDLDEVDIQWLHIINKEREDMAEAPIDELTMEKIIEQCEIQCQKNIEHALQTEEGLGIEYDEDICCAVCRAPDSEEDNEMVFCDKCDICVHQACYGVVKIPEGSWMCRVCALGLQPECMLCGKKGGAMKSTRSGTKWAHVNCALWVPEVSIGDVERMEPITNIFQIPASRWALICSICRERTGACIQCSVKTCKTAYHVTCAVENNLEMEQQLDENKDVKFRSYCLKHTNLRKSPNSDGTVKSSPRKKSEEEKANARALRIQKVTEQFQKFVKMKEVAASLNFKEDLEVVDLIFEYWKLKRKSGFNKPLLNVPREEDKDKNSEEYNLHARMKMFVHLRQDLERVRNLCYMVQRREKLSRQMLRLREGLFKKQCEFFNGNISRMSEEEVDWAARAGEISARVPFPMSEDVILNKWLSIPSDGPKLMLDDEDDTASEDDSDMEMEAKKERDKKKREKAAARKKKEAEATARLKEKLAQVKGPVSSNTRNVKHRRVSSMDGKIIYEDEIRSRKGGTPNSYVSDTSSVVKEEDENKKSESVESEREDKSEGDSSEVKTSKRESPERNHVDERKAEKSLENENKCQESKIKNPVKGVKSENFKERPISKNKQENRENFKKHRKKDKVNSIHNHKLGVKSPPVKRKSIESKDKNTKHSINKKERKNSRDPKQRDSSGRHKTPVSEKSSEKNHIKQEEKLHFLGRGLEVKEEWTYWQTSEQRKLQSEKEVRHDEDKNAAEFLLQEVMDDKELTPITPFEDGHAKPVIDDFIERHTEDQSAADFLANEIFDEKISNQDVKDKFAPLVSLLEKETELLAAERLLNELDDDKNIVDWKCGDLLNSKSEKVVEGSADLEIRRESLEEKPEDLLSVEKSKLSKEKDSNTIAPSETAKLSKEKTKIEKKGSPHPERTEKDLVQKNHRKSNTHKEKKKSKTGKDQSVSNESTSTRSRVSNKKESLSGKDLPQSESPTQNGRCETWEKDTGLVSPTEKLGASDADQVKMKKRKDRHQKEKKAEEGAATKERVKETKSGQEKAFKSHREECNKKTDKSSKKTNHSSHEKENKSQKVSVDSRHRESKDVEGRHRKKDKHAKEKEAKVKTPKPSKHHHEETKEKKAESGKEFNPSSQEGSKNTVSEKVPKSLEKKKKSNNSKEQLSPVTPLVLNDSSSVDKLERSEKQKHFNKSKRGDVDKKLNEAKQTVPETGERKDMPVLPIEKKHDSREKAKLTQDDTTKQEVRVSNKYRKQSTSKPVHFQLNGEEGFKEPVLNDGKLARLTHKETNGKEDVVSLVSDPQVENVASDDGKLSIFDVQGIDDAYHEDKSVDTNTSASIFDWDPSEQLFEPERRRSSRRTSSVSSERSSQADAESTDDSDSAATRKSKRRKRNSSSESQPLTDSVKKGAAKQMLELRRLSRRRGSLSSDRSSMADSADEPEELPSSNSTLKSAKKTTSSLSAHSAKPAKVLQMSERKESIHGSQSKTKKRRPSVSESASTEKIGEDAISAGVRVAPDSKRKESVHGSQSKTKKNLPTVSESASAEKIGEDAISKDVVGVRIAPDSKKMGSVHRSQSKTKKRPSVSESASAEKIGEDAISKDVVGVRISPDSKKMESVHRSQSKTKKRPSVSESASAEKIGEDAISEDVGVRIAPDSKKMESDHRSQSKTRKRRPSVSESASAEKIGEDATSKDGAGVRVAPDSKRKESVHGSQSKTKKNLPTVSESASAEKTGVDAISKDVVGVRIAPDSKKMESVHRSQSKTKKKRPSVSESASAEKIGEDAISKDVGVRVAPDSKRNENVKGSLSKTKKIPSVSESATAEKIGEDAMSKDGIGVSVGPDSKRKESVHGSQNKTKKRPSVSESASAEKMGQDAISRGGVGVRVAPDSKTLSRGSYSDQKQAREIVNISSEDLKVTPSKSSPTSDQEKSSFDDPAVAEVREEHLSQRASIKQRAPVDRAETCTQEAIEEIKKDQSLETFMDTFNGHIPASEFRLDEIFGTENLAVEVRSSSERISPVELRKEKEGKTSDEAPDFTCPDLTPHAPPEMPEQTPPLGSSQLIPQLTAQVPQEVPRVGSPQVIPQLTAEVSLERTLIDSSHFIPQLPGQASHETPHIDSSQAIPQLTAEVPCGMPSGQSPPVIPQLAPQVPPNIPSSMVPPGIFPINDSWLGQKTSLEKMEDLLVETSNIDSFTPQREQLTVQVTKSKEMFNFQTQPLGEVKHTRTPELFEVPHNSFTYKGVPEVPSTVVSNRRSSRIRQASIDKNMEVPQVMIPNMGLQPSSEPPILDALSSDFSELPLHLNSMTPASSRKTGNMQTLLNVPGLNDKKENTFVEDIVRDPFEPLEKSIGREPLNDVEAGLLSSQAGSVSWRSEEDITCPAKLPANKDFSKGLRRRSVPIATPEKSSEPMTVQRTARRNSSVVGDRHYQTQLNYPVHEMALFNAMGPPTDGAPRSLWESPRMVNSQSVLDNYSMSEKMTVTGDKLFRMPNHHIQSRSDPPSKSEGSWREILDNMSSDSGQFGWNPSDLPEFVTPVPPSVVNPFRNTISNNVSFLPEPQKTEKSFPEDKAAVKQDVETAKEKEKEVQQTSDKNSGPSNSENGVYFHKKLSLSLNQRRREERCKTRDAQDSLAQENSKLSNSEALSSTDHSRATICQSVTSSDISDTSRDGKEKMSEGSSLPGSKSNATQGSGDSGVEGSHSLDMPSSPGGSSLRKDGKERERYSRRLRERKKASDSETDADVQQGKVQQGKSKEKRKVDENRNVTNTPLVDLMETEATVTKPGIAEDLVSERELSKGIGGKDLTKPTTVCDDPLVTVKKSPQITNLKEGKHECVQSLSSHSKRISDKHVLSPKKEDVSSRSLAKRHLLTDEFSKHIRGSPFKPGRDGRKKSTPLGKKRTPSGRRSKRQKRGKDGKEKDSEEGKSKGGVFDFTSDEDEAMPVKLSKPLSPRVPAIEGQHEVADVTSLGKKEDGTGVQISEQGSDMVQKESLLNTPHMLSDSQGNPQQTPSKIDVSETLEIQSMTANSNSSEINPIKKRWLSGGKERRKNTEREKMLASASEDASSKVSVPTDGKEQDVSITTTPTNQQSEEPQDRDRRRSLRVRIKEKEALALSLQKAKEEDGPVNERRASLRARKKDVDATNLKEESGDQEEDSHMTSCPPKVEESLIPLPESKKDLSPQPLSEKGEQEGEKNSAAEKEEIQSKESLTEEIGAQTQSQASDISGEEVGSESSSHSDLKIEGADGRLVIKNWGKFTQRRKKKKKKKRSPLKEGYSTGSHTSNKLEEGSSFCVKEASDGPKNGLRLKITTLDRYFKPLRTTMQPEEKEQEKGSENLNGEPSQTPIKLRISKSLLSPSYKSPKRKHSKVEGEPANRSLQPPSPVNTSKATTLLAKEDKPQPLDVDVFEFDSHSPAIDDVNKGDLGTPKPSSELRSAEELNQSTASTVISPCDSPSPKANVTEKRELCYVSFSESDHSDGEKPRRKRRRKHKEKKVSSNNDTNSISDTLQFLTSEIT